MPTPTQVVDQMYHNDAFSQWLGIERLVDEAGRSVLQMTIRPEMLNGFDIAHGAITYALADSALAFAANSHGRQAVSIETSISHTQSLKAGERIIATAEEEHLTHRVGIYRVLIKNESGATVAIFKGTVYRTSKDWEV